jgi:hypothetical protein
MDLPERLGACPEGSVLVTAKRPLSQKGGEVYEVELTKKMARLSQLV